KRAYCLKIQPATGSFARNLIYSTKPRCTALIQAEGELSPSLAAIVTSPAKIFCQNVNFSFFVIDVMLLTS
ncbi:hypothetical protein, partial [Enterobacter hormaechei]